MGWTFYNSSGQQLKNTGSTALTQLDIDGATDIGAAIVDADLFIIDDGAGGTNRKTASSRIKTYAGVTQAVQSDIEAETNEDTYIPPDLIKHSPGVAKVWCLYEQNGTHSIRGGYNMTSVSDGGGAGDTDLLWATDFSGNETYAIVACGQASNMNGVHLDSQVAGGCTLLVVTDAGSATDLDTPGPSVSCFGDQ